jgi:hypothetical protein
LGREGSDVFQSVAGVGEDGAEQQERVQHANAKVVTKAARRCDVLEASHRELRFDIAHTQDEVRTTFPHAPSIELTALSVNLLSEKSRAKNFLNQLMIWDEFWKGVFSFDS